MKRKILPAGDIRAYEAVTEHINSGWVLDPNIHRGEPFGLEASIVYHLVFYENEDEKPKIEEEKKTGELEDTESIISVEIPLVKYPEKGTEPVKSDIDKFISDGYILVEKYAKTATLIKRRSKEEAKPVEAEK